jgi:predicted alpha/beta-fold hydrolase
VGCSSPWDLNASHMALQRSWMGREIYSKTMGGNMRKLYETHKEELLKNEVLDKGEIEKCQHLWEFDR